MIFRNWILENFPFLEDDFDALTDYELFCKMVAYMKKSLEKVAGFREDINNFNKELDEFRNYFDNLDVQEEINNKLDEMYESGELATIIEQFIQLQALFIYGTVSEMLASENLVNGSYAKTNGFYTAGDLGGAYYKIRTVTNGDVIDDIKLFALINDDSLVAELILEEKMNAKQFGATGDGETDDTDFLQAALNNCKNIVISNGVYLVDASESLNPISNSNIEILDATIKAIANNLESYTLFNIDDVDNVTISGNGTLEGDKTAHTGATGEHGHVIALRSGSSNITIKDLKVIKGWGDGIYVGDCIDVLLENLKIDNNRRNGISVVDGENIRIINCIITSTSGTNPQAGIDIEPNNGDYCKNILIDNCILKDNAEWGITTANRYYTTYPNAISGVTITNCHIDNCKIGLRPEYAKKLVISNNVISNNAVVGVNYSSQDDAVFTNNTLDGNGYAINLYYSHNNIISDCVMINCSTTNPVMNLQGCKFNKINNNKIYNNQRGINLTSTIIDSETVYSSYNKIENNDIYDNSKNNTGTYNNITLNNYTSYNVIKNNNFTGVSNDCNYNIYVGSSNSGTTNIIANNIFITQATGVNYLRGNSTLDNIVDGALEAGNLRV